MKILTLYPTGIYVYGIKTEEEWKQVKEGDYVIFYVLGANSFEFIGRVAFTYPFNLDDKNQVKEAERIAEELWGKDEVDEKTWPFLIFLDSVRPISLSLEEFEKIFGKRAYELLSRFSRLSDKEAKYFALPAEVAVYCGKVSSWVNICDKVRNFKKIEDDEELLDWINKRGENAYLIFGTDVVPYKVHNYQEVDVSATPLISFIKRGGTVIWIGDVPFFYVEINGKKKVTELKANPFKFSPASLDAKNPIFTEVKNSIIGELLNYKPLSSWRPIVPTDDYNLIPISYGEREGQILYSSWIYKFEKGYFVRLYDKPEYVDVNYVLNFPETFQRLKSYYAFKIS